MEWRGHRQELLLLHTVTTRTHTHHGTETVSQTTHTHNLGGLCLSISDGLCTGSKRLPNSITLPMREVLPGSRCTFAPPFPGQTTRVPGTTLTHHHFSSLCFLVALRCTLGVPRTTPVYVQLITWGTSPKIKERITVVAFQVLISACVLGTNSTWLHYTIALILPLLYQKLFF